MSCYQHVSSRDCAITGAAGKPTLDSTSEGPRGRCAGKGDCGSGVSGCLFQPAMQRAAALPHVLAMACGLTQAQVRGQLSWPELHT